MFLFAVFQMISFVFGQIDSDNVRAQIGLKFKPGRIPYRLVRTVQTVQRQCLRPALPDSYILTVV